jgi:hypothetical protein
MKMKRMYMKLQLVLLICVLFAFIFTACSVTGIGIGVGDKGPVVKGGPPPHAPAHGYRAKYAYHYYPDAYVYFDISRKLYFYLEGDKWSMSVSLPHSLYVQLGEHVAIEMDSDKPYTHFDSHKKKFPPGQLKKKKKRAKSKK